MSLLTLPKFSAQVNCYYSDELYQLIFTDTSIISTDSAQFDDVISHFAEEDLAYDTPTATHQGPRYGSVGVAREATAAPQYYSGNCGAAFSNGDVLSAHIVPIPRFESNISMSAVERENNGGFIHLFSFVVKLAWASFYSFGQNFCSTVRARDSSH